MPITFNNYKYNIVKNNINKYKKKHLKMNKEIGMILPKKRVNTSVVAGK